MSSYRSALFGLILTLFNSLSAVQPILDRIPIHEAFVTKFTDPIQPIPVAKQPPPPIQENIPPQPFPDAQWVSGYWAWIEQDADFSWVCGVWRRPPPGHQWIPGNWVYRNRSWVWTQGFWSTAPEQQLTYIPTPPPKICG